MRLSRRVLMEVIRLYPSWIKVNAYNVTVGTADMFGLLFIPLPMTHTAIRTLIDVSKENHHKEHKHQTLSVRQCWCSTRCVFRYSFNTSKEKMEMFFTVFIWRGQPWTTQTLRAGQNLMDPSLTCPPVTLKSFGMYCVCAGIHALF